MSFRHTFVTNYIYLGGDPSKLKEIKKVLSEYARLVEFTGSWQRGYGYFHGIISDLDSYQTKMEEKEIYEKLYALDIKITIIYE